RPFEASKCDLLCWRLALSRTTAQQPTLSRGLEERYASLTTQNFRYVETIVKLYFNFNGSRVSRRARPRIQFLHPLHCRRYPRNRALVEGRITAESHLDLSARCDTVDVYFVDIGNHTQLSHVDDLSDAGGCGSFSRSSKDLCHNAICWRAHQ